MKRTLVLLLFIMSICSAFCQNRAFLKPDYDLIKFETQDSGLTRFYPKLMKRWSSFDVNLNLEDFKYLYYGFLYQKGFEPFMTTFNEEKLVDLCDKEGLTDMDTTKIFDLADQILSDFPFDLHSIRILRNVYRIIGNSEMYQKLNDRYYGILEAIYSTGDGSSKENAMHIISVNNELEILIQNKLELKSHAKMGDYDCITAYKGLIAQGNIINLYFYTGQIHSK